MAVPVSISPGSAPRSAREILLPFLRPYAGPLAVAALLNGLHGFAITFQVFTVGWLVDWVLHRGDIPADMSRRAGLLAGGYLLVSIFGRMATWHLGFRIFTRVREKVLASLRTRFFSQLNALCLRFHMKRSSGELFSYLFGSPLNNVIQFYQHCSSGVAGAITTVLSALGLLLWTDSLLTVLLTVTVGVQVYMMELARRANRKIHLDYQKLESGVTGSVADLLRGTRAVKMYAMEREVEGEFGRQIDLISHKSYERDVRGHMEWMKQEAVSYTGFALMLVACALRFRSGAITLGEVSMFMLAFQQLSGPMTVLSQGFTFWGSAQASLERIAEVLQASSTTPDPVGEPRAVPAGGEIEFRGVTFAYENVPVLKNLSLRIPPGQSVALVGPSGAGKSTVAQLLLRLYDPDSGEILLGGQNLRECTGSEVRRRFGVVPQDPFIFRTTIRQNLRVADPDATDGEIEQACRLANAWEFIDKLPEKLDSLVGEGGANLSGGQRQRLAIARVLLANPPVMLFDEATSALDSLSERLIQETLRRICQGRTSILIAHRLATVKDCQRVLVLQEGSLVQDGTYADLVSRPGLFRSLVEGQHLAS
ncbi:MAG: ABC transporter ATP-binding protein [Verrucomicrobia bacterium]|nr:ABC transporter ATP-binding protein [Verrucomicrobiota bacterium]NBU68625.1 ABC transporter ATP-binding protein [Verrucomicrobiota bacterium]NDC00114.1 ABC transporter ATP-binding protein [Verrucomicrobiota bacterium]